MGGQAIRQALDHCPEGAFAMRWPWSRQVDEENEDVSERFDDVLDDDEQDGDGDGDEQEPELDEAQRAYVERQIEAGKVAAQAAADAALEAERARHRAELVEFARTSGVPAQPQQQQQQQQETSDPYAALGERPDPSYEPDEAREWDRRYRAVLTAETVAAVQAQMQPVFQQLHQRQATSTVDDAVARTRAVLEEEGINWGEIEGFDEAMRKTLLSQDMASWDDPTLLASYAMFTKRGLKPGKVETRPRGDDGRYAASDAQRRSLQQVAAPRDAGRAAGEQPSDAEERALAEMAGMTVREWRAYDAPDLESHRRFQEQQSARNRGRR